MIQTLKVKRMSTRDRARAKRLLKKKLVPLKGCYRPKNYDDYILNFRYSACGNANQGVRLCINCVYKFGDDYCKRYRKKLRRKVKVFLCRPYSFKQTTGVGDYLFCEYVYEETKEASWWTLTNGAVSKYLTPLEISHNVHPGVDTGKQRNKVYY
jgi:hypothetical protein